MDLLAEAPLSPGHGEHEEDGPALRRTPWLVGEISRDADPRLDASSRLRSRSSDPGRRFRGAPCPQAGDRRHWPAPAFLLERAPFRSGRSRAVRGARSHALAPCARVTLVLI